jgi:hypothetical protein
MCAAYRCPCRAGWHLRIEALASDFEKVTPEDQFAVK